MTRRQVERDAEALQQLGVAVLLGSGGDLVIVGARLWTDLAGFALGAVILGASHTLTGWLGGPKV